MNSLLFLLRHMAGLAICVWALFILLNHPVEDLGSHLLALGLMALAVPISGVGEEPIP